MDRLLETLVWLQNLPVETAISSILVSPLFAGPLFWVLQGLLGIAAVRAGPEIGFRVSLGKGTIAVIAIVSGGLMLFFALKPVPNDAGMPTLQISFVEEDSGQHRGEAKNKKPLIVFVHGWKGDDQTFGLFPNLLSMDRAMAGFGYTLFHYTVHMRDRNLSIIEIANVLLRQLMRADVDKDFTEIYIVAHSLGGVITREMVILNKLSARKLPFRGVVALASPFNGSAFGKMADLLGVSVNLTRDIGPKSSFLSVLNSQWQVYDQSELWQYCFGSTVDQIVSAESASFGCGSHYEYSSDFGHTDLVKPAGRSDVRYTNVMKTILQDGKI